MSCMTYLRSSSREDGVRANSCSRAERVYALYMRLSPGTLCICDTLAGGRSLVRTLSLPQHRLGKMKTLALHVESAQVTRHRQESHPPQTRLSPAPARAEASSHT